MLMKLRTNSSIGYLDIDAIETYDVDNQEIIFKSILYVKDRISNKFTGYILIYNDMVDITIREYCSCDVIKTKGKMLIVDNIDKIIDKFINQ